MRRPSRRPIDVKRAARMAIRKAGFDITRAGHTPFGFRWEDDVTALGGEIRLAVDVGGNEGQTARLLTSAFASAQIVSYEPVQSTFDMLSAVCADLPRVTCFRSAVGAERGEALISVGARSGENTLARLKAGDEQHAVPVTTLDYEAAIRGWNHIDLLKIDTEGFEIQVLRGATSLLQNRAISFILMECDFFERPDEPHGYFPKLFDYLNPLGYRVVAFYTGGADGHGWRWGDVLFMLDGTTSEMMFSPTARRTDAGQAS